MLPVLGFFAGITQPEELHRIGKAEGKGPVNNSKSGVKPLNQSQQHQQQVQCFWKATEISK